MNNSQQSNLLTYAFIPLAIAINIGIGALVKAFNLPLYLDSIGTILATLLLGWRVGAIVGILGFAFTSIFINPFAIYFIGTQFSIALWIYFLGKKNFFKNIYRVLLSGLSLGVIAAIVSAPVIIYLFQGATGNGAAIVTSFFAKMGNQIINSVFLSGISIEPIDKTIQCISVYFILKSIPQDILKKFDIKNLTANGFIN